MSIHRPLHSLMMLLILSVALLLGLCWSPALLAIPEQNISASGWTEMNGSATGGGISQSPYSNSFELALAEFDGHPIIAWEEEVDSYSTDIYVKRWNGSNWVEFSDGSASGRGISQNDSKSSQPDMMIGVGGMPIVAWADNQCGSSDIFVKRWIGTSWAAMGGSAGCGISDMSGDATSPSLVLTADGPVIAWQQEYFDYYHYKMIPKIYVKRWNGGKQEWEELGAGSASGSGISGDGAGTDPDIVVGADGKPLVAWTDEIPGFTDIDSEIYVKRWNGSSWGEFGSGSASGGGVSNDSDQSRRPSFVVNLKGNPIVAWESFIGGKTQIHLRRWSHNQDAWIEMGSSASGGGVSNGNEDSIRPSVAIHPDGSPVVAWQYGNPLFYRVYVKRWDGSAWVEMGSGSASDGGISSDYSGCAVFPSLAFSSGGMAVVGWESTDYCQETASSQLDRVNNIDIIASEVYALRYTSCYPLTLTHTGEGSDPVPSPPQSAGCSSGTYLAGEEITLTANPASGWHVAGWSGTNNNTSTAETNTLTMPVGEHTASVAYAGGCYELALTHTGEGSDPAPSPPQSEGCPSGSYLAGEEITLTANPASGWRVAGWEGTDNNTSTAETNTLTMPTSDHAASVAYAGGCYILTLEHTGEGSDPVALPDFTPGCLPGTYLAGQKITLNASPAEGWFVTGWAGTDDDNSMAEANSLTMPTGDHIVSVNYGIAFGFMPIIVAFDVECPRVINEQEPNNNDGQANRISCIDEGELSVRGLPNDKWDLFSFYSNRPGRMTLEVKDHHGGGPAISLYYGSTYENDPVAWDPDASNGLLIPDVQVQSGRYYIMIYTVAPNPSETREYTLTVRLTSP